MSPLCGLAHCLQRRESLPCLLVLMDPTFDVLQTAEIERKPLVKHDCTLMGGEPTSGISPSSSVPSANSTCRPSKASRGLAKNCAIFPIASFWRIPIVALLKSKHEPRISDVNRINAVGETRDHIVFDHGCFQAFRDKTTLQK